MDIDTDRIRLLLCKRDELDREIAEAITGKKPITCGHCNQQGHSARSCPSKVQST